MGGRIPFSGNLPVLGGKKKFCNLIYCNDEAHSEVADAVINPGTNTKKWLCLDRFIFNFRSVLFPIG